MVVRISCFTLLIWLAGGERGLIAADPPAPEEIIVFHDIAYRQGTSRQ